MSILKTIFAYMESYYSFFFEIKDVVEFSDTQLTVYALTYKEAIQKIYKLKLPQLERYSDIEEHLRLLSVEEIISGLPEDDDAEDDKEEVPQE